MASRDFAIKTILTASDTQLKAAFGNAGNEVQKLGRKLQNEARQATSLWGKFKDKFKEGFLMGGGMALAGRAADFVVNKIKSIAREIPDFVEKADNIGKVSQKLGLTTDSFQRLSYAMNISDVSAESFQATFKKLNVNMAQLKTFSGLTESGLKKLDPQLMMTLRRSKDSTEAFLVTADAIKATVDPAKRAAIAQAVFGKQGQELLPILLQGREGITALMKETEKYGEILSGDTIEAAGKFQDSQKRLTASLTQIKGVALSALVTTLEPFVTKISEWVAANKELIGSKINSFLSAMVSKGTDFFNMIKPLLPVIFDLAKSVGGFFGQALKAAQPLLEKVMPLIGKLFEGIGPALVTIIDKLTPLITTLADLVSQAITFIVGDTADKHSDIGVLEPILGGQPAQDKLKLQIDARKQLDEALFRNDFSKLDKFATEQLIKNQMDDMRRTRITSFGLPIGFGKEEGIAEAMSKLNPQQQQWAKEFMSAPNAGALGLQNQLNNNIKVEVNGVPGAQVKVTQSTGQDTTSAGRTAPAIPMTRRGGDLE
ncbi:MAG TPA: hypothetical protein VJ248_01610 [Candidatus Udaeobacter sp.]|nr:hypothetical protein [Candidatus Udaeobacter sp.]